MTPRPTCADMQLLVEMRQWPLGPGKAGLGEPSCIASAYPGRRRKRCTSRRWRRSGNVGQTFLSVIWTIRQATS